MAAKLFGSTEKRQAYRAWFDRVAKPQGEGGAKVMDWNDLLNQRFDYIILIDYLDEYINKILSSKHSQYHLLKTFHYDPPFKINVEYPFVNPHIFIFQSRTPNQTRNG
jgi:hypothetical protein